jgi:uncharacterized protein YlaI
MKKCGNCRKKYYILNKCWELNKEKNRFITKYLCLECSIERYGLIVLVKDWFNKNKDN